MALEEDQVAAGFVVDALPEMRKADVIERGGGGEGGNVAADVGVLCWRTTMAMAFQRMRACSIRSSMRGKSGVLAPSLSTTPARASRHSCVSCGSMSTAPMGVLSGCAAMASPPGYLDVVTAITDGCPRSTVRSATGTELFPTASCVMSERAQLNTAQE